ncbi:1-acyl-sn-glycerol-3-phosphate acyltransferase [Nocardioides sp. CFH 31398]|uniref:lysophospholipid acyltransferase family protein n=1 Tax=Nocardioides sp. CFH 31398 TaxID=2919579 RepID=UPI001F0648AD|nr:lysophospholipid acyltransferase family protein [Nocardioides sp. CFH 31398]MCH1867014.1 1-acyl-sn-glycerol-3-phosphate acyltransferase [Nocardioides sp. CFH 31398]
MSDPVTASAHRRVPASDHVRHPSRWLLHGGRPLSRWLIRRRFAVRTHGGGHVPARGGVILAANHIGWSDGPLLAIFSPRPAHVLTKVEMFDGALGAFLTACGQLPLDRFSYDPHAVRTCLRVLRDGGVVGVFPEGRRGGGDLERFHRGAAYLALVTGAPVVPVAVLGTREPGGRASDVPGPGAVVDLVYGDPVHLGRQDWPRTREQVTRASLFVRERMLAHLDEARQRTGRDLPGPLAPGELEDDPYTGLILDGEEI